MSEYSKRPPLEAQKGVLEDTISSPSFVRFEHYIFRDGFDEDAVRELEDITNCHTAAIEEAVNRVEIASIHPQVAPTEDEVRSLGLALREAYSAKLRRDFPALSFDVAFNDQPGLNIEDYELSFWQSAALA